jgi:hypothetical protein
MTPGYDGPFLDLAATPMLYEQIYQEWYAPGFQPHLVKGAGEADFISTVMFEALIAYIENAPDDDKVHLSQADRDFLVGTYDAAVMYADMWLGVLLARMEALGLDENTVLLVVSDHGEELLDHGFFNHRAGLWDENTHVPMLLRAPGVPSGTRSDPVSLTAVSNTLLGRVKDAGSLAGEDLLSGAVPSDNIVLTEGANGDLAARNASRTLLLPGGFKLHRDVPINQPKGAQFLDSQGNNVPWSAPEVRPLWDQLTAR